MGLVVIGRTTDIVVILRKGLLYGFCLLGEWLLIEPTFQDRLHALVSAGAKQYSACTGGFEALWSIAFTEALEGRLNRRDRPAHSFWQ